MAQEKSIHEWTIAWAYQRELLVETTLETESTNEDAKVKAGRESADAVLYVTAHQSQGRGRGANTWLDTGAGECLLSTWSLTVPTALQPIVSPRMGLALYESAHKTWPSLAWGLKAPNDLYLDGKKIAGLLLESVHTGSQHRFLIGLGMNIFNHPRSLVESTHLSTHLSHPLDEGEWFQFLDEWQNQLNLAVKEGSRHELTAQSCIDLARALNANKSRPYVVEKVSPLGDLLTTQGTLSWMEL